MGDPVDVVTGASVDARTEFRLAGPLPFVWRRHSDSARAGRAFALGWGHAHGYERALRFDLDGLRYVGPLGATVTFAAPRADGDRVASGARALCRVDARRYLLQTVGEPDMEFLLPPGGDVAPLAAVAQGGARVEFAYDARGRLAGVLDSARRHIAVGCDEAGRVTHLTLEGGRTSPWRLVAYTYDAAGNLARGVDAYGQEFTFGHDDAHRIVRRTDCRGYAFLFAYDEQGRCVHSRGEDGLHEVWIRYAPEERTTTVVRADGGRWVYRYDEQGTVRSITGPDGGERRFEVDADGAPVAERGPGGTETRLLFDRAGGLVAVRAPDGRVRAAAGDDAAWWPGAPRLPARPSEWEYGDLARPSVAHRGPLRDWWRAQLPTAAHRVVERLTSQSGACAFDGARVCDELGRLLEQRAPDGGVRRWEYDREGNVRRFVNFAGGVCGYEYASWSLWTGFVDPTGAATALRYTRERRVAAVRDAGGTVREYAYDQHDRLAAVRRGGVPLTAYQHDGDDNLVEKRDGAGALLVAREADAVGRVTRRALASGEVQEFAYDEHGLAVVRCDAGEVTFHRDAAGRAAGEARDGLGVEHARAPSGRLEATTYFGRFTVEYAWARGGELTVRDPGGGAQRIRQLAPGLLWRALSNGSQELARYDDRGRTLAKVSARYDFTERPWGRRYAYTADGGLARAEDDRGGTTRYDYDLAGRLVGAARADGGRDEFAYDPAGNLLRQPGLAGAAIGGGNQLLAANGDTIEYDGRDRLRRRSGPAGETLYEYDSADQLVRCALPDGGWRASYDPLGRRAWKEWGGVRTDFHWDGDRLAAERWSTGQVRLYVYPDLRALTPLLVLDYDGLDTPPEACRRLFVFADQVATPVALEDDAGRVVWSARVAPYGAARVRGRPELMPLRFPGHYYDSETKLHYNRARYYSPELGRYLQPDPLGVVGGINLYAYSRNPLVAVDVTGLSDTCPPPVPPSKPDPDEEVTQKIVLPVVDQPPPGPAKYDGLGLPITGFGQRFDQRNAVVVYTPEQREHFRVVAGPNGSLVYPNQGNRPVHSPGGTAIYVMDQHGNMYVHENPVVGSIHHSSIAGGEEPVAAGHVAQIGEPDPQPPHNMNNQSGHYAPPSDRTDLAVDELGQQGVDTSNIGRVGSI